MEVPVEAPQHDSSNIASLHMPLRSIRRAVRDVAVSCKRLARRRNNSKPLDVKSAVLAVHLGVSIPHGRVADATKMSAGQGKSKRHRRASDPLSRNLAYVILPKVVSACWQTLNT